MAMSLEVLKTQLFLISWVWDTYLEETSGYDDHRCSTHVYLVEKKNKDKTHKYYVASL